MTPILEARRVSFERDAGNARAAFCSLALIKVFTAESARLITQSPTSSKVPAQETYASRTNKLSRSAAAASINGVRL